MREKAAAEKWIQSIGANDDTPDQTRIAAVRQVVYNTKRGGVGASDGIAGI
jgi:hypothetical protein